MRPGRNTARTLLPHSVVFLHFHEALAPVLSRWSYAVLGVLRMSYEGNGGGTCGIPCGKPAGPCRDLVGMGANQV